MSVCGRVAFRRLVVRQWRDGGLRATAGGRFSQGICRAYARQISRRPAALRRPGLRQRLDLPVEFLEGVAPAKRPLAQLFSSGSIFFWNSSNEVSPLILSPLTKK